MADDLAKASMYAVQTLVGAMREAGLLSDDFVRALNDQSKRALDYAAVRESNFAVPPDPAEAAAIRHGVWWARECVAPTASYDPAPVSEHPKHSHEWPDLEEIWRTGGEG